MGELRGDDLQGAVGDAIQALRQVATDSGQPAASRVAAAAAILDFASGLAGAYPREREGWIEEEWEEESSEEE